MLVTFFSWRIYLLVVLRYNNQKFDLTHLRLNRPNSYTKLYICEILFDSTQLVSTSIWLGSTRRTRPWQVKAWIELNFFATLLLTSKNKVFIHDLVNKRRGNLKLEIILILTWHLNRWSNKSVVIYYDKLMLC